MAPLRMVKGLKDPNSEVMIVLPRIGMASARMKFVTLSFNEELERCVRFVKLEALDTQVEAPEAMARWISEFQIEVPTFILAPQVSVRTRNRAVFEIAATLALAWPTAEVMVARPCYSSRLQTRSIEATSLDVGFDSTKIITTAEMARRCRSSANRMGV